MRGVVVQALSMAFGLVSDGMGTGVHENGEGALEQKLSPSFPAKDNVQPV